jgi:hypothetical protein
LGSRSYGFVAIISGIRFSLGSRSYGFVAIISGISPFGSRIMAMSP